MNRQDILSASTLSGYLSHYCGKSIDHPGGKFMVSCPLHEDKTPSMSCDDSKGLWKCFSCGLGGTVIDLHMRINGMSVKDAMFDLAAKYNIQIDDRPHKTATYHYRNEVGKPVMEIDRIEEGRKKKFRQYTVDESGQEHNGIEGVSRTLYRIEKWHGKDNVCLCEGEKCVHALEELGILATTNPGGSGGWLDAYSELLKGKNVEIWPDNDKPGEKWLDVILASLRGKVKALRVCRVPDPYNDVADMVDAQGVEYAAERIAMICDSCDWISRGITIDVLSSAEAYQLYVKRAKLGEESGIQLNRWLPSLDCRPLQPGDLGLILGDTGVGKTALLANLAYSQAPKKVLFFELELSPEDMAERFVARDLRMSTFMVEQNARAGRGADTTGWSHVYICPLSTMTTEKMEQVILESELKIGAKPDLVLLDYVGLMQGGGDKRYERMSTIAENLKRLARSTKTVIFIASQVKRDEGQEVGLHSAKDSGSLENSAQIVLGASRTAVDEIKIKILKQTRKSGKFEIITRYSGDYQRIEEIGDAR
jgi:KaiC/GvpD/RAD55 family RecA-like ATPase